MSAAVWDQAKREQAREYLILTFEDWRAEGVRRFGPDETKWKFVCPGCGHVQAVEDFREFKAAGATPGSAYFNCIGRYAPNRRDWLTGDGPGPCNYTSGGLLDIRPVTITEDGKVRGRAFAFASLADESEVAA